MNGLSSLLLMAVFGYSLFLVFLYLYQDRMLFLPNIPSRIVDRSPSAVGLAYESVDLVTGDNIHLDGWFIPAPEKRGVILFCHGNAGNISHRFDSLLLFHRLGFSTLIFDYRGYGRSQGRPSEAGTYLDVEAAWQYLTRERSVAPFRIVLFGRSLGAAVAVHQAAVHTPGALIVESSFTSVPDRAAELYPFLPVRWLSRLDYNVQEQLQRVSCPVLVVHSRDDEIIPFSHGRALFAQANEPKQFLEIGGGHNDGFILAGQTYVQALDGFFSEWIK
ncbi:MAG: alpha/beta hydrolase [Proteobacteria bacterium]|nr:alpha/beta hydrolase [Pseudomonadota bacterium]MBU1419723.1 alpha/beta hydrolase [Pseudomonadota bacterium]MBU1454160.1 alpha/beta hydrolase [Pseudomonadota bacterium]